MIQVSFAHARVAILPSMKDAKVQIISEIDSMEGFGGCRYHPIRKALGVEAFGISIIDIPSGNSEYPNHDHEKSGQEEVYVALSGSGEIEIEGERFPLDENHIARVGAQTKRKVWPGKDGMRILVVGNTPGKAYQPEF